MKNPYRIGTEIESLLAKLDYLDEYLSYKVADADDFDYVRYLLGLHDRLAQAMQLAKSIEEIHEGILKEEMLDTADFEDAEEDGESGVTPPPRPLRKIVIEVTQGMVNQNLLTLTKAVKRGTLRRFEEMRIYLPTGECIESKVVPPGNKLQERGLVGRFYRNQNVRDGDRLQLDEIAPGEWNLRVDHEYRARLDAASNV